MHNAQVSVGYIGMFCPTGWKVTTGALAVIEDF